MKKTLSFLILFFFGLNLFSQSKQVAAANRKTAERCLKLAENCMLGEDWQNALSQAELGLAYDSSISDLVYIKAMAQNNLNYRRADILETIKNAFEIDNWINYNKNGARILYADLLSEIGLYDESLQVLNEKPMIYSADSEYIRIKDYYRMGTADSINQARQRLSVTRKVYSQDSRFPDLFFMFEMLYMNYAELNQTEYEIPELVQVIADAYIQKLPDYNSLDTETEIIALMFAEGEQQQRLLKAIGEINQNNPLFALAGLKTGILSEEKAYNLFISSSENVYHLEILESFAKLITNQGLKENLFNLLNSFEGIVYVDEDLDLRNELVIQYSRGRPQYITYDSNNDQVIEIKAICDFGEPVNLSFENENISLVYEFYPYVKQVSYNSSNSAFYFLDNDFSFIPFEIIKNKTFEALGADFYIPYVNKEIIIPDVHELVKKASCIELPTSERNGSEVIYTVFEGNPVFASFGDSSRKYAYATIQPGCPFVRYVDYDGDEIFETAETYDIDTEDRYSDAENQLLMDKIFGENSFSKKLYLKRIEIDRNSDTVIEYKEEFLGKNGKISFWDDDGNGLWDYEYIRYPDDETSVLTEESIFYEINGIESVLLKSEANVPVMIRYDEKECSVVTGNKENCYWIVEKGTAEQEAEIYKNMGKSLANGMVHIVHTQDGNRYTVIRVDNNYYFKILPESLVSDEELE